MLGAGQKFQGVQRFCQKVAGAGFQGLVANAFVFVGGDHHDGRVSRSGQAADTGDELQAIELGHHVIDHDQTHRVVRHPFQGRYRVGETTGLAALELVGNFDQQAQIERGVIDDENVLLHSRFRWSNGIAVGGRIARAQQVFLHFAHGVAGQFRHHITALGHFEPRDLRLELGQQVCSLQ